MLIALICLSASIVAEQGKAGNSTLPTSSVGYVLLDGVTGLQGEKSIKSGEPITFSLRMANTGPKSIMGLSHGFRIYSKDGAEWGTTKADTTTELGRKLFDGGVFTPMFGITGKGADTVGFGGFAIQKGGMQPGFDAVALRIQIGPIDQKYEGKTICLDSCFYPPGGAWIWSGYKTPPSWGGPYCYTIGGKGK